VAFYVSQKYNASACWSVGKYTALSRSAEDIAFVLTSEELEVLSIGHYLQKIVAIALNVFNSMIVPL